MDDHNERVLHMYHNPQPYPGDKYITVERVARFVGETVDRCWPTTSATASIASAPAWSMASRSTTNASWRIISSFTPGKSFIQRRTNKKPSDLR